MIQTQLLRLDPPYQIISAGGRVGIQVATLIVTEDKTTEDGGYAIDTHSHPVVSYGLKQGVPDELKYNTDPNPDTYTKIMLRLQPEGAVWNKVEIGDVKVLGLAGAQNSPIDLHQFISIAPVEHISGLPVWNTGTAYKMMYTLNYDLHKVGLKLLQSETEVPRDKDGNIYIKLELLGGVIPFVCVVIKDAAPNPIYEWDFPINFFVRLFDKSGCTNDNGKFIGTDTCGTTILNAATMLRSMFFPSSRIFFIHRKRTDHPHENAIEQLTAELNKAIANPK